MTTVSISPMIDREWLTAKIANPWTVKRCLGRLDSHGFEYRVVVDERQLRIIVRRFDLEEVLELLADLSPNAAKVGNARSSSYRQSVRMLAAIPLGAVLGSILGVPLGMPVENATIISALGACLAAFIATFCRLPAQKQNRNK